jgi:ribosomal protein S27AE
MNAKRIIKHTRIPKSRRYCPKCDDITTFGYNHKVGHSGCSNCGYFGRGIIFLAWCNPRLIDDPVIKNRRPKDLPPRIVELVKLHKMNYLLEDI